MINEFETMDIKMIVPVSKKLIKAMNLADNTIYVAYFEDGLLYIGEPQSKLPPRVYAQVEKVCHDKGYTKEYEEGYDDGYYDGREDVFFKGYRAGFDDAVEGYGYRDFSDCGIDCDFDCIGCKYRTRD